MSSNCNQLTIERTDILHDLESFYMSPIYTFIIHKREHEESLVLYISSVAF